MIAFLSRRVVKNSRKILRPSQGILFFLPSQDFVQFFLHLGYFLKDDRNGEMKG